MNALTQMKGPVSDRLAENTWLAFPIRALFFYLKEKLLLMLFAVCRVLLFAVCRVLCLFLALMSTVWLGILISAA